MAFFYPFSLPFHFSKEKKKNKNFAWDPSEEALPLLAPNSSPTISTLPTMDSTQTCKTDLERLLDEISPSFQYEFEDGRLCIDYFGENRIDNIQKFVNSLAQNTTPIIRLDLSSNVPDM
jgi:hypothetical protein